MDPSEILELFSTSNRKNKLASIQLFETPLVRKDIIFDVLADSGRGYMKACTYLYPNEFFDLVNTLKALIERQARNTKED